MNSSMLLLIRFVFRNVTIVFQDGRIHVYREKRIVAEYEIRDLYLSPNVVFRRIKMDVEKNEMFACGIYDSSFI